MFEGNITTKGLLNKDYGFSDDCTVAANGAMYRKDKVGMIPELIDIYMKKRKDAKSTMLQYEGELEKLKSDKSHSKTEYKRLQNLISKYNNEQMAFKIAMNSLYGALGNAFFRYYTLENARAVTLSGQYIIISVGEYVDTKLNAMFKTKYPWVIYQDTDSIYLDLSPIVDKFYSDKDPKDITTILTFVFLGSASFSLSITALSATFEDYIDRLGKFGPELIGLEQTASSLGYVISPIVSFSIASAQGWIVNNTNSNSTNPSFHKLRASLIKEKYSSDKGLKIFSTIGKPNFLWYSKPSEISTPSLITIPVFGKFSFNT